MNVSTLLAFVVSALVFALSPAAPALAGEMRAAEMRAAEMIVQGEVVDVVPVTRSSGAHDAVHDCQPARPGPDADLVRLLEWDLRAHCETRRPQIVDGYRVYYRWDGRTYSRVMVEPPGDTVSLRVRVQ